ncbi:hypothetical protein YS40_082 [Thermus phage phiYS40]|uniref:hypothetical protein n=1 Tax=Thermus phage phiYS40 TaxID=407392 RepID=UPI0000E689C8|nr:hypothetical protein YS40_082 [Thermus phage phiYS40]ABJ91476.1 hypothetical protein YS40_082 [Thermus phage phiYS40]
MGIDCANINRTQEPNFNGFIDELLPYYYNQNNLYSSFKFPINGRNYLFYFARRYDEVIQNYVVEAKLVDETSCYEDTCSVVSSIDLTYVDSEIFNALSQYLCSVQGGEQIYKLLNIYPINFYDLQQVGSDEYLAVIKVENSLFRTTGYYNTYILSSFDIYLIFRISSNSMTLERIEIPILEHAALGGCLPDSATYEQGFLKYKGNSLFLYAGVSSTSDLYLMPKLLMYSLDTQSGQKSILAQHQLSFSTNPSDYGISTLDPYTFQVNSYFLQAVHNSDDLFVLGTYLYFYFYDDTSGFGVELEPLLLKVIKFSNRDGLTISDFYTPAFYSDLNTLLTNLLNVSNTYVNHIDFINGKFFKIGNKVVLVGMIDYLTIEDLPDIGKTNVAMSHYTFVRIPATFVIYDFDEANLKFVFNENYFTGVSEDNNLDFYYKFFNSALPIFEEKTTNPTTPYGVFVNNSAKSDICQILSYKYAISDCSSLGFYFVNIIGYFIQLLNAVQSFSDGCSLSIVGAFRLLNTQNDLKSAPNESPIEEYLVIVLFRFSFDEQGNLIKEYKILDAAPLYVASPSDTYTNRGASVHIPQIFFDNQKRLHYSVYVYSELPQGDGGGVAA